MKLFSSYLHYFALNPYYKCICPPAIVINDMLSAPTPPLHCASILQPATPPHVVAFESWTISTPICLNLVHVFIADQQETQQDRETRSLNLCVCFYLFLSCLCFPDRNGHQLWVPLYNLVVIDTVIPLLLIRNDVKLAQMVRARDCYPKGHQFDSGKSSENRELKSTWIWTT